MKIILKKRVLFLFVMLHITVEIIFMDLKRLHTNLKLQY